MERIRNENDPRRNGQSGRAERRQGASLAAERRVHAGLFSANDITHAHSPGAADRQRVTSGTAPKLRYISKVQMPDNVSIILARRASGWRRNRPATSAA